MNIIVDANVLFSAILKDSKTREIILKSNVCFVCPSMLLIELDRYKPMLLERSGLSKNGFDELISLLMDKITIATIDELLPYAGDALDIIKDIDENDAMFIACALAYPDSILWSNDAALKRQKAVRVLNTTELMKEL